MNTLLARMRKATTPAALLIAAMFGFVFGPAEARPIQKTAIFLDLSTGEFRAELDQGPDQPPYALTSAREIADGIFIELDLRVKLENETREVIEKMVDQGFTSEPSGCEPGAYGPLDMEDGLRYFFEIGLVVGEKVRATIYPGNRSTHWTNDVFCEFDANDDETSAVFRLTGYYYVIHRNLAEAIDIQLRPITLTDAEVSEHMGGQ